MALNATVNKIVDKGAIKVYGKRSLNIGEIVLFAIAIILLAKKASVNLANKWVIVALVLIFLAFVIW